MQFNCTVLSTARCTPYYCCSCCLIVLPVASRICDSETYLSLPTLCRTIASVSNLAIATMEFLNARAMPLCLLAVCSPALLVTLSLDRFFHSSLFTDCAAFVSTLLLQLIKFSGWQERWKTLLIFRPSTSYQSCARLVCVWLRLSCYFTPNYDWYKLICDSCRFACCQAFCNSMLWFPFANKSS